MRGKMERPAACSAVSNAQKPKGHNWPSTNKPNEAQSRTTSLQTM
jgi:hypothetical protein